jgi:hypothetical protein
LRVIRQNWFGKWSGDDWLVMSCPNPSIGFRRFVMIQVVGLNRFAVVLWFDLRILNLTGSVWRQRPSAFP